MGVWLEYAIIAFIIIALLYIAFKGGTNNPQSTGQLGRRVGKLTGEVSNLSTRVGHVENDVDEIKRDGATTKDIERLEERLNGHNALLERTSRGVERIERMLMEKGLGK